MALTGFAKEIVDRYVTQGVGVYGTSIFVGARAKLPTTIPAGGILSIAETSGPAAEETHDRIALPAFERPSAQIVTRGNTYEEASAKARQAYNASRVVNGTLSGTFYRELKPMQEPFELPLDSMGYPRFAFNVAAVRQPA